MSTDQQGRFARDDPARDETHERAAQVSGVYAESSCGLGTAQLVVRQGTVGAAVITGAEKGDQWIGVQTKVKFAHDLQAAKEIKKTMESMGVTQLIEKGQIMHLYPEHADRPGEHLQKNAMAIAAAQTDLANVELAKPVPIIGENIFECVLNTDHDSMTAGEISIRMRDDVAEYISILMGKKKMEIGRVYGGPSANEVVGLLPVYTTLDDYFSTEMIDNDKSTQRLMEKPSLLNKCATRSREMRKLAIAIETMEIASRKTEIVGLIRAKIQQLERTMSTLTTAENGQPSEDPAMIPVAPAKRKLEQNDGAYPDQPSFKHLRVCPTAKATAMAEAATVRGKILNENLDQARKILDQYATAKEPNKWLIGEAEKKVAAASKLLEQHASGATPWTANASQFHAMTGCDLKENLDGIAIDNRKTAEQIAEANRVADLLLSADLDTTQFASLVKCFMNGTTDRDLGFEKIQFKVEALAKWPPRVPTCEAHPQYGKAFAHAELAKDFILPTVGLGNRNGEANHMLHKGVGSPTTTGSAHGCTMPTCSLIASSTVLSKFTLAAKTEQLTGRIRDATELGIIKNPSPTAGPVESRMGPKVVPTIEQYLEGLEVPATQNAFTISFQAGEGSVNPLKHDQLCYGIPFAYGKERVISIIIRGVDLPNDRGMIKVIGYWW